MAIREQKQSKTRTRICPDPMELWNSGISAGMSHRRLLIVLDLCNGFCSELVKIMCYYFVVLRLKTPVSMVQFRPLAP